MTTTTAAQMYAVPGTSYMPASLESPSAGSANVIVYRPSRRPATIQRAGLSTETVADLLRAAGPLSVEDIAGGLGVSVREAQAIIWRMVDDDCVRPDEWQRMKLQRRAA